MMIDAEDMIAHADQPQPARARPEIVDWTRTQSQ